MEPSPASDSPLGESSSSSPAKDNDSRSNNGNGNGNINSSSSSKERRKVEEAEKLKDLQKRRRREKLLRRAIPILLTLPWFLGIIWTALHPLVSVITGETKCRGQYIDENGLDVHRHRVKKYPLERTHSAAGESTTGMCAAILSEGGMSPSVECLRHEATETMAFDVVRILPSVGPVIESAEAVVIIAGGKGNKGNDWYGDDLNASILNLIRKLGSGDDSPWLTKTVFVVSPANLAWNATTSGEMDNGPPMDSVVDTFIASYLGDPSNSSPASLPPDFTFPIIRSVLVLNDVASNTDNDRTEVRILPQGTGGALPNLDLVFATYMSLQSHPTGDRYTPSHSVYYGDSDVSAHPFGGALEERLGNVLQGAGDVLGLDRSAVRKYAKDLAGLLGFVAAMVIGPRQPHASALSHGIDSLTIEVRIPDNGSPSTSIHPHYTDLTRCVEHLVRSISNLHERLHHSIAQYTMPSPSKFVSHGEYIFPALLVSLPMIVRAATLALRDLGRFQFWHVGMVLGSVVVATFTVCVWAAIADQKSIVESGASRWVSYIVFIVSYLFVISVARQQHSLSKVGSNAGNATKQTELDKSDYRRSLRFVACLVGIYLHAPLLLANYSLGFPSSAFWSPLLASLVLPPSLHAVISRNRVLSALLMVAQCIFLFVTSQPILLVPRMFRTYTPYVLGVYTPLHLLLAALWLA